MNAETREKIGLLRDKAENFLAFTQLRLPPETKIDSLKNALAEISTELSEIYEANAK